MWSAPWFVGSRFIAIGGLSRDQSGGYSALLIEGRWATGEDDGEV